MALSRIMPLDIRAQVRKTQHNPYPATGSAPGKRRPAPPASYQPPLTLLTPTR